MQPYKKAATVVQLAEARAHQFARKTPVYQRWGRIVWLNTTVKGVIRLTSWCLLVVICFEMTIGFTGLTFLYWLYRNVFG